MSPKQSDPNTTSPIDRDELRALVCRARDIETQKRADDASSGRAEVVVVNRSAVAAWLGR
jgi:hypothetical protein